MALWQRWQRQPSTAAAAAWPSPPKKKSRPQPRSRVYVCAYYNNNMCWCTCVRVYVCACGTRPLSIDRGNSVRDIDGVRFIIFSSIAFPLSGPRIRHNIIILFAVGVTLPPLPLPPPRQRCRSEKKLNALGQPRTPARLYGEKKIER